MPILLLLLLGGAAVVLVSQSKGGAAAGPSLVTKLSIHGGVAPGTGLDAGLSADQAKAIHTAIATETSAARLTDFAHSLPQGMPIALLALTQAAHARSVSTVTQAPRVMPGVFV